MDRTLLLSAMYEPMATISWRRAITMLTLGKVEVIEAYDRQVRSPSIVFKLPAVVRLVNRFRRYRRRVKFSKQNVFARDRWRCQYCGKRKSISQLTLDHVIPRSRGGANDWENVVTSCIECNTRKANRTPAQVGMKLRSRPIRPDWLPMFIVHLGPDAPDVWKAYCFLHS
jgi:5-methylcytosine-specific restriction endonuclease McrA